MSLARDLGVASQVDATGPLPHRESTAELLAADLLWLPTITRRDGGPVANVPAKTYEYLGSGRPILALAGPGDVRDLLAGSPRCRVVVPSDDAPQAVADLIARAVRGEGPAATEPDPEDARAWRRAETARGVAAALRAAVRAKASSQDAVETRGVETAPARIPEPQPSPILATSEDPQGKASPEAAS
jgi:glycosyltransferase involved in cell wall biosynthesis